MTADSPRMLTATPEHTVSRVPLPGLQIRAPAALATPMAAPLSGTGGAYDISQWSSHGPLYISVAELPPALTEVEAARLRLNNPQPLASDDPATSEFEQD